MLALYYKNRKLSPAEDRALYYSFLLADVPARYTEIIQELQRIRDHSIESYIKRETLFKESLLSFFH